MEHPKLTKRDIHPDHTFLRNYDEYVQEVSERVKQFEPTEDDTDTALTSSDHVSL